MVAIIDYGVGNLFSLTSSFKQIGAEVFVSGNIAELDGFVYLNLSFRQNTTRPWASSGYEVGFEQIQLCAKACECSARVARGSLSVSEDEQCLVITDGEKKYTVSKTLGLITDIENGGKHLILVGEIHTADVCIWMLFFDGE